MDGGMHKKGGRHKLIASAAQRLGGGWRRADRMAKLAKRWHCNLEFVGFLCLGRAQRGAAGDGRPCTSGRIGVRGG